MIAGSLFALSLITNVAYESLSPPRDGLAVRLQMTEQQKEAVIQPLMRSATDCVARAVRANPKFRASMAPEDINVLIVTVIDSCIEPMRVMIDAHDRLYGDGTGEAFFMGPYLDVLPAAVTRQVKGNFQ